MFTLSLISAFCSISTSFSISNLSSISTFSSKSTFLFHIYTQPLISNVLTNFTLFSLSTLSLQFNLSSIYTLSSTSPLPVSLIFYILPLSALFWKSPLSCILTLLLTFIKSNRIISTPQLYSFFLSILKSLLVQTHFLFIFKCYLKMHYRILCSPNFYSPFIASAKIRLNTLFLKCHFWLFVQCG